MSMVKQTSTVLSVILVSATLHAFNPQQKRTVLQRLTTDPPLPAELTADADAYPLARVRSTRNPLSFAPFKVTKLKTGWKRTDSSEEGMAAGRGGRVAAGDAESKHRYSFTMNESGKAQWDVRCTSSSSREFIKYAGKTTSVELPTSGAMKLRCDIATPGGPTVWSLDWHGALEAQGAGMAIEAAGKITSPSAEFRIAPLFSVENSRAIGDVPVGYIFRAGDSAVAAIHMVRPPGRFVVQRSVAAADRSLLAAASAALVLNERLSDTDDDID